MGDVFPTSRYHAARLAVRRAPHPKALPLVGSILIGSILASGRRVRRGDAQGTQGSIERWQVAAKAIRWI